MDLYRDSTEDILIGPFLDKDGNILTDLAADMQVYMSHSGGPSVLRHSTTPIDYDRDGYYKVPVDLTDLTVGGLRVEVSNPEVHLPVWEIYDVYPTQQFVLGAGASKVTLTLEIDGHPVPNASVWLTKDSLGTNVVAGAVGTNSDGQVQFLLDIGATYYFWAEKSGMNPVMGKQFVAVAD